MAVPNAKPTEGWGLDGMKEEEAAVPRDAPAGAEGVSVANLGAAPR